ncbi:hypothetical protein ACRRTK_003633 [Alexandromys fortis]
MPTELLLENSLTVRDTPVWHQCPELPLKSPVSSRTLQSMLRADYKACLLLTHSPYAFAVSHLLARDHFPAGCRHRWLPYDEWRRGGPLLQLTVLLYQANPARGGSGFCSSYQTDFPGQEKEIQQRAPTHAPLRAGQAPSRRRAAAGGGSGPRFLSSGLRASSHRSPGELRLAAAAEPAAFLALPHHPAPGPGRSHRGGVRAEPTRAAPPSGPSPGQPSLPPRQRPAAQPPGCGARATPAGRDRTPGAAPGGRRDVPKSNLGGHVRKRNSAGAAPATLFPPPRTPSRPLPPPFFPPRPGLRGRPPACLAVLPPPIFASIHLFVPHPLGTPAPLPSPLASWTVLQAADAARGEVAWTAVPRER